MAKWCVSTDAIPDPRKGRIDHSCVCISPKVGSIFVIKKAKARRGSTIKVRTARTKRATGSDVLQN